MLAFVIIALWWLGVSVPLIKGYKQNYYVENIKVGTSSHNMKIPEKHPRKTMANVPFTPGEPSPTSPHTGIPTPPKTRKREKEPQ